VSVIYGGFYHEPQIMGDNKDRRTTLIVRSVESVKCVGLLHSHIILQTLTRTHRFNKIIM